MPRCIGDGRWRFEVGDDRTWWLTYETEGGERRVAGADGPGSIYALGADLLANVRVLELGGTSAPALAAPRRRRLAGERHHRLEPPLRARRRVR
jgi:hypothetical protein